MIPFSLSKFYSSMAPYTHSIGFLDAPMEICANAYIKWKREDFPDMTVENLSTPVCQSLHRLEPLSMPPCRAIVVSTDSSWTAYFDNAIAGSDTFPPIAYLSKELGCRGVIATYVPHTLTSDYRNNPGTYGATEFELFGPGSRHFLGLLRHISVRFDSGKWKYFQEGESQPFENFGPNTKRVRDRFTSESLQEFCRALDISVYDETYYSDEAWLFELRRPVAVKSRVMSFEQARAELGLA